MFGQHLNHLEHAPKGSASNVFFVHAYKNALAEILSNFDILFSAGMQMSPMELKFSHMMIWEFTFAFFPHMKDTKNYFTLW